MFSGFQSNAFQNNAFQIVTVSNVPLAPNGNRRRDYTPTSYELENNRRKLQKYRDAEREAELELISLEGKIQQLELKRLRDLADENMQIELIDLLKEQLIFQQILRELQIKKQRLWRDNDDILVILMCLPFNA